MTQEDHLLGGRYRLAVTVGRGGMGTVWRAHDEVLGRDVAIKEVLLPPGLGEAERQVLYERTFREARASARLTHPNVVTVHDVIEEDGRPWIVMEYVAARSLQEIIDADGPIDPWKAADVGRQTLIALRHAHAAGILHRDVKPSNVLITDEGRAVLTDFGIAQMEGDANLTQTGLVMGSPAYIPPERAKGERAVPASDLWALGATLYAAVEGKAPYERSDALAALAASLTEPVPPPRNAGPLTAVLTGLLAREPYDRMTADQALPMLTRIGGTAGGRSGGEHGQGDAGLDQTRVDNDAPWARRTKVDPPAPAAPRSVPAPPPAPAPAPSRVAQVSPPSSPAPAPFAPPAAAPVAAPVAAHAAPPASASMAPSQAADLEAPWAAHDDLIRTTAFNGEPTTPGALSARPAAAGSPASPARRKFVTVLVVLLVVAVLVLGALLLRDRAVASPARKPVVPSSPYKSSGTEAEVTAGTGTVTMPRTGTVTEDEDGFSVSVPRTWTRTTDGKSVIWLSPDGSAKLQIDQTEWDGTVPRKEAVLADGKAGTNPAFPGYALLGLIDRTYHGVPATDWEFTYTDPKSVVRQHAVDRFVFVDGRPYAIYFRAAERDWATARGTLDTVFDTFQPR